MSLPRMLAFCAVVALTATAIIPGVASAQKRSGTLVMLVQPEPPTLASGALLRQAR